jgi:O-antigen ligase
VQLWKLPRLWAFLLLFIVLFPKLALAVVPQNTSPLRVDDLVIAGVLGIWVIRHFLLKPSHGAASPLTLFLGVYLGACLISTVIGIGARTTEPIAGALHLLRLVEYTLLYYFFFTSVPPDELPHAARLVRFSLFMVAGIWIAQHWTAMPPRVDPLVDWSSLNPSFSASYDFGGYLMIALALLYAFWITPGARSIATTAALGLGAVIVLQAESRASFAGLFAAIGLDILLRVRLRTAIGLSAIAAAAPFLMSSVKMARFLEAISTGSLDAIVKAVQTDPSIGMRLQNWQLALERWQQSPLVGDGLGAYLLYVRQYRMPGTPDGWYVRTLAETGLLGLLAFVLLVGSALWVLLSAYRREERPTHRAFLYGAALALFGTMVNAIFIDSFVSYKIMGVFWAAMGVATRAAVSLERAERLEPAPGGSLLPLPSPAAD